MFYINGCHLDPEIFKKKTVKFEYRAIESLVNESEIFLWLILLVIFIQKYTYIEFFFLAL